MGYCKVHRHQGRLLRNAFLGQGGAPLVALAALPSARCMGGPSQGHKVYGGAQPDLAHQASVLASDS